jgi:hypothetical protein
MQESEGKTYCCRNCAAMASGTRATPQGAKRCAHCESVIVDASTQVEHEGQTFCCNNCAAAMAEGATHRST